MFFTVLETEHSVPSMLVKPFAPELPPQPNTEKFLQTVIYMENTKEHGYILSTPAKGMTRQITAQPHHLFTGVLKVPRIQVLKGVELEPIYADQKSKEPPPQKGGTGDKIHFKNLNIPGKVS